MRTSIVVALTCLFVVLGAMFFLMRENSFREPRQERRQAFEADQNAPEHAQLITALTRVSDETRDLRLQITELSRLLRGLEGLAASRAIGAGRDASGDAAGAPLVERREPSGPTLRARVSEQPDPEKRNRFDALAGQSPEQQSNRARSHWFLTYAEVLDRYGVPDWVTPEENGSVSIGYTLKAGTARFTFRDGLVVGMQAP
jgi:hypothetical protein